MKKLLNDLSQPFHQIPAKVNSSGYRADFRMDLLADKIIDFSFQWIPTYVLKMKSGTHLRDEKAN